MLLRSGRETTDVSLPRFVSGSRRRRGASTSSCRLTRRPSRSDETASRSPKRKCVEAATPRQVRQKSPPTRSICSSPHKAFHQAGVVQSHHAVTAGTRGGDSLDEAAAIGPSRMPDLPPHVAAVEWRVIVANANACIEYYNKKHAANFVYKDSHVNLFNRIEELGGDWYCHLNFDAQDKNGRSQLFFGEINESTKQKDAAVTCCCPISPSDAAAGKSFYTWEEAVKHVYPKFGMAGEDPEHCYGCLPVVKHPEGACFVAGHHADAWEYREFF